MSKNPSIEKACQYIYEGKVEPIITNILQNPELINLQSKENHNKTILMCTIEALQAANYPIEQSNLVKLFYTIINQKNLDLKITDDNNNNVFDLIFKYARNTDHNIAKNLFTLGENLLTLINNQQTLNKILIKKKPKTAALIKKRKNFMQYIFPNIKEELLFEPEIEYLQKLQPRIINILSNIFQFKQQMHQILQDPINNGYLIETPFILPCKGITMSWNSWLKIIHNPQPLWINSCQQLLENYNLDKGTLVHNIIIEDCLNIYKAHHINDKLLLAKLENYILVNQNNVNQAINNNPSDLLLKNILELIDKYKQYLGFLDQNASYKLGNEYDKNKN